MRSFAVDNCTRLKQERVLVSRINMIVKAGDSVETNLAKAGLAFYPQ